MALSMQSIEILLDLLEIKIGCMHVQDRDDAKELFKMRYCRQELMAMKEGSSKDKSVKKSVKINKAQLKKIIN